MHEEQLSQVVIQESRASFHVLNPSRDMSRAAYHTAKIRELNHTMTELSAHRPSASLHANQAKLEATYHEKATELAAELSVSAEQLTAGSTMVAEESTPMVAKESMPMVAKESTPMVAKESTPGVVRLTHNVDRLIEEKIEAMKREIERVKARCAKCVQAENDVLGALSQAVEAHASATTKALALAKSKNSTVDQLRDSFKKLEKQLFATSLYQEYKEAKEAYEKANRKLDPLVEKYREDDEKATVLDCEAEDKVRLRNEACHEDDSESGLNI